MLAPRASGTLRRRGGLALRQDIGPSFAPEPTAPSLAPRFRLPTSLSLSDLRRVAWTLPFAAFLLYIVAVVTSRFSVGTIAVPVALAGVLLQGKPLKLGALVVTMSAFLAWSTLALVASASPAETGDALVEYFKLTLIVFAGVNALRSPIQVRVFMAVIVASFIAYPGKGAVFNYLTGSVRQGRAAWSGVYGNPNDLAGIALLVLSVAVALLAFRLPHWWRLALLGASGFIGFVMLVTQSRGALIGLAIFGVGLLVRSSARQRKRVALGIVAAVAVLSIYAPAGVWDRLSGLKNIGSTEQLSAVDREGSAEQRFEIWKVATTIAAEHPILGVGLGAYGPAHAQTAMRPDFKRTARGPRDAHSTYLSVLAETGLVGLVIFLAIIGATWRHATRIRRRAAALLPSEEQAIRVLQLGLAAYLVAGIWGSYARLNMLYLHLLLIWVIVEATRQELARAGQAVPPGSSRLNA